MDSIIATVDAQGFTRNGYWYIRELAIEHNGNITSFDVRNQLRYEHMTSADRKTNKFIEKHLTGLTLNPGKQSTSKTCKEVGDYLRNLYKIERNETKKYFLVNNHHLEYELDKRLGIETTKLNAPSLKVLTERYNWINDCDRHTQKKNGVCADLKVRLLAKWLEDQKQTPMEI